MLGAALWCCDPISIHPRGIVADVLLMAAFEFGYPVVVLVLVVADDSAADASWLFHTLPILCAAART